MSADALRKERELNKVLRKDVETLAKVVSTFTGTLSLFHTHTHTFSLTHTHKDTLAQTHTDTHTLTDVLMLTLTDVMTLSSVAPYCLSIQHCILILS